MPSTSVTVGSSVGLHARPAAIIAEAAGGLGSTVTINGVDASSSLMIMTLGAKCGDSVEVIFRREAGRVLATLIRLLGDFDLAEEAAQEAFTAALQHWQKDGLPANPRAGFDNADPLPFREKRGDRRGRRSGNRGRRFHSQAFHAC